MSNKSIMFVFSQANFNQTIVHIHIMKPANRSLFRPDWSKDDIIKMIERCQSDYIMKMFESYHYTAEAVYKMFSDGYTFCRVSQLHYGNKLDNLRQCAWIDGSEEGVTFSPSTCLIGGDGGIIKPDDLVLSMSMYIPFSTRNFSRTLAEFRRENPYGIVIGVILFPCFRDEVIEQFKEIGDMINDPAKPVTLSLLPCTNPVKPVTISSSQPVVPTSPATVPLYKINSDGSMTLFIHNG